MVPARSIGQEGRVPEEDALSCAVRWLEGSAHRDLRSSYPTLPDMTFHQNTFQEFNNRLTSVHLHKWFAQQFAFGHPYSLSPSAARRILCIQSPFLTHIPRSLRTHRRWHRSTPPKPSGAVHLKYLLSMKKPHFGCHSHVLHTEHLT